MNNNCFAYKLRNKCRILKSGKCIGESCSFYKTKEQFKDEKKKAVERIVGLDKKTRNYINETYYGGKIEVTY